MRSGKFVGMRRVDVVRIDLTQSPPRCEVTGVANRLPITRPISIRLANELAADGVPVLVKNHS